MADTLTFTLVSPEKELFSGEVEQVIVPGALGDFGVLPRHAPLMSTIRPGAITVFQDGKTTRTFVRGGFADVTPDGLTILAEEATPLSEVKPADLEQRIADARDDLADAKDDASRARAQADLDDAEALKAALSDTSYDR